MIATSLASASRPLWRLLEHYGIDPLFVFQDAGLDPALMDESRGRYKAERALAAWAKAEELIDDPCFGLKVAELWSPTDFHALGYAFLASSTLRAAFGRLCRYLHVINDCASFTVEEDDDRVVLSHQVITPGLVFPPVLEDVRWALFMSLCRASSGGKLDAVEVRFRHSEPSCKGNYFALLRCPIQFDAESSAVVFERSDIDRPLPAANRELARANDQILSDFLDNIREDDLITRVKKSIAEELPSGSPSDEVVAKQVFMTPRTLHRRLKALGCNYSQLLESVRRGLAERYVADPSLSLSEIGFLLGFSEQSAFSRAFRRWTGQAPSAAREAAGS